MLLWRILQVVGHADTHGTQKRLQMVICLEYGGRVTMPLSERKFASGSSDPNIYVAHMDTYKVGQLEMRKLR